MPENLAIDLNLDEDEDDLLPMSALEDDEEVKLESEETVAERIKLNNFNRNRIKNLDSKQIPYIIEQIKAGNDLNKSKNETRKILYILYKHNKII